MTVPTITGVTTNPGSGDLRAGRTIMLTLSTSAAVTVNVSGGTPTLALNDGGVAFYDAGNSTSTALVFDDVVAPGQNVADLQASSLDLNGATVMDGSGNNLDISGATVNPPGTLQIDTTAPTITSVATNPGSAVMGIGQTVTLTLGTSEAVTVNTSGGTPRLTLNDGGVATYSAAGSTSTALAFIYTIAAGDSTAALAATGLVLNGATIKDGAGNNANVSGATIVPAGTVQVDTTAPTISSVTTNPGSGDLRAGQAVTLTLATTKSVSVDTSNGTPTLSLNDGGVATYNSGASSPTNLVFTYVVAPGQNTADLTVSGLTLNGAVITDGAGNNADVSGAVANPAGVLQIDTTAPTISSVTANPSTADLGVGQTVTLTVNTSEAVTVNTAGGTPTLSLSDGGTATYNAGASTSTALAFIYTVGGGDNAADLTVTALNLNNGTIKDGAGNTAVLTGAVANPAGTLQIDTTAPTITGVTASPATADLGIGQTVTLTVATSEAVTVNTTGGTPTLTLNDGGTATYNAGASTSTALAFIYTVAAGDNIADLAVNSLNLNNATIQDGAGNNATLAGAAVNPAGTLQIDGIAPTITGVTASPSTANLGIGQTVTLTLATSEAVTVNTTGGTPTLTLNDGGTATYNAGASTSTALAFTYTVAAGDNTADLTVTGLNLNNATIKDAASNNAVLTGAVANPAGTLQIDGIAPTITSVTANPSSADLSIGQTVTLTLATSEAVTVNTAGGTPTLSLNDGGVATYNAGASTTTALAFIYTVAAGDNTADLAVTAVNLNNGTIKDGAGNNANLAGGVTNPAGTLQIDTTAPTISSVTANPSTADLGVGQTVTLTVNTSEAVTVNTGGGTPTLTLSDGGTATYNAGSSTSTALAFIYTVGGGDNAADLTVTGLALNSATITDGAGNSAILTGAVTNPAGVLQIDTTAPTITGVTANPSTANLGIGQTVTLTVATSEAVTVNTAGGSPTLTLNDGGTATYNAGASTSTALVFTYTVAAGDTTADLAVSSLNLNNATIRDGAGNNATLAGAAVNPAGTLQIDGIAPTISSVTANPSTADVGIGQTVTLTVATSEAVTVNTAGGSPTLTLNDGGTATYNAGASTSTALAFIYTVAAGDNTADLTVTGLNLNNATIKDGAGNNAVLTGAVANPAGTLQIDGIAPTITGVTANPATADLGIGQTVTLTLATSESVTVNTAGGTPTLSLSDGGTATYNVGASTGTALAFIYTVAAGDNAADLTVTGLNLNNGTIRDGAGNNAVLTGAVANPAGTLQIDGIAPTITGVTASPATANLGIGQTVTLTVATSEAVTVNTAGGTPTLSLSDGGTATYSAGASTTTALAFIYTVGAGDNAADLTVTGLNLNNGTIQDGAGNNAVLTGAVVNPAGTLQIDGIAPTITSVTANPATANLGIGQTVTLTVATSEAVTVNTAGGSPTLTLNDGGTATYNAGASTSTALVFTYTVAAGDTTADLAVSSLNLNNATIRDGAGNNATLAGAAVNPAGTLQIDGVAPTISSVTANPSTAVLGIGQTVTLTVNTSEAVTVNTTGGTPTLSLSDGGTATYNASASTSTALAFVYTVAAGDNAADLTVTGLNLNNGTIKDGAGNNANLAGAVANPAGTLQIDTPPIITSVTANPSVGNLRAGMTVNLTLNMSETVSVDTSGGLPTLSLNDGGIANYVSATSTALVFAYVVAPGQNTADLTVTGLTLNGAIITDGTGNNADVSGAVANPAGVLQIDTTAPTISSVTANPSTANLGIGQTVTLTVNTSEAVTVNTAGGTPTLSLSDGGTATYNAGASTSTALAFVYTVAAGDNAADLTVTGLNLNNGTIKDGAGNSANLAGAVTNPAGVLQIDTTAPTITGVTASPATANLGIGQTVTLTVATSEAVTVNTAGGSPTLTLNDGGTATYNAGASTSTALAFIYTVAAGDNTADLAVSSLNLNNATIRDGAGNSAVLTGAVANPAGTLQIDGIAPTISSVTASPSTANLGIGQTVTLTVNTSEAVTVNTAGGTPRLSLSDGGVATYNAGASTTTALAFVYTVAAGDNAADLTVTGLNLNNGTIRDGAGNNAVLTGAVANPAGVLQIDGIAPTITSVTASPATADLGIGQTVTLTVNISEAVTVNTAGGTPTLSLNDGGMATYNAGASTSTALAFVYTVAAGDNAADLSVTGLNLNNATIRDGAGNNAILTGAVTNPAGVLQIDTTAPTITGVTANPATANLGIGQTVTLTLAISEAVTVNTTGGTPTLSLNDGGVATYNAGASTTTALAFTYTVAAGDNTADLTVTGLNLNNATIRDGAGNNAVLTGAVANPAGTLQIDGIAPTITAVTANPATADLGIGQTVTLTLATSEAVTVNTAGGTPTLSLSDGGTATYNAGASTSTALAFVYTVRAGDNAADLTVTGLNLNNGTIRDGAGNNAILTGAVANPAGVLQIDTTAPTITGVTANPATANLGIGQTVTLTLATSEAVTVNTAGGSPTLTLNDGGTATYNAGASTSTALAFTYTVAAGDNTADLAVSSLNLNNATIRDGASNNAVLTGAAVNPAGTLQIDGIAPTISNVTANPSTANLGIGQTVTLTVNTSEAVTVNTAGGTPTLTLNDGGTATYNAGASTTTALAFVYTVAAGDNTADLTVTGLNLNNATIKDGAGNNAVLTGAVANPAGTLQIDGIAPTISSVTANPATANLGIGQIVRLTVATSEAVTVNTTGGTPTLSLSDGGTATYNAGASTSTALAFTYTVAAGDNAADLTVTGLNLNNATIKDGAGNNAVLTGAVANPAGTLQIDGIAPTITSVTANPATANLGIGQTVTLTVATSEAVTVNTAGGTPTLSLSDGGTATYNAGASTSTALAFIYTVAAGDNAADLAVTGLNLNSATIKDNAGNNAILTGAVVNPAGTLQIDGIAPTITSVTANPATANLGIGQTVTLTVNTSEAVTVNTAGGAPTLSLSDGGTATYNAGASTSTALAFIYTVRAGDNAADLAVTGLSLNNATIKDGAGNNANLAGAVTNPAGVLQIDTTAPTITAVTANPSSAVLGIGQTVTLTLATSEAVAVNTAGGTPTLTLNDGGVATYNAGASTSTALAFTYTVAAGDNTADLASTGLNLNGATIKDAAGNAANLAGAVANPAGTLQINTTVTPLRATPPDAFWGGSTSDVLVTDAGGDLVAWPIASGTLSGNPSYIGTATNGWNYLATGDFNGDGTTDILVSDSAGDMVSWNIQNGALSGTPSYVGTATNGYQYLATGDFNGDGTTDLLVTDSNFDLVAWTISNGTLSGTPHYLATVTSGWHFLATGDFYGIGTTGVLVADTAGNLATWNVQNNTVIGSPQYVGTITSGWRFVATGNFYGTGTTGLLMSDTAGNLATWNLQNGTLSGTPTYVGTATNGWSFFGTGDYNGDGTTDILVSNTSGALVDWTIRNGTLSGTPTYVGAVTSGWHAIANVS